MRGVPVKPLRQGDLDSLCSVYAVLNAFQYLIPAARDEDYLNKLMIHIVGTCSSRDVTAGGDQLKMVSVFEYARDRIAKDLKVNAIMSHQGRIQQYQSPDLVMKEAFSISKGVFIMGYEGRASHWTVVRGIKGTQVLLFDSCEQIRFARKDLVWSKDVESLQTDKVVVDPDDLNWVLCGGTF